MPRIFAEGRERNDKGWLQYPRDAQLRRAMFSEELTDLIMTHPAKQQAHLHKDICEYVSKPGDTILDPFGGVGTSLLSATLGRNVVLIEIENYYAGIVRRCIDELSDRPAVGRMLLIQGDNRLAMPIPCDHIITSPPYGNDLYSGAESEGVETSTRKLSTGGDRALAAKNQAEMSQYAQSTQNIGKFPPFVYKQVMQKVYKLMVDSLRPGGTLTITHRDRISGGERVLYIDSIIGTLRKLGMRVEMLDKWEPPKTLQANVNLSLGSEVVLDEDIIIMRKEK